MNVNAQRLSHVRARITKAAEKAQRPADDVRLLAVSKLHPAAAIRALHNMGQRSFGENRVSEGIEKRSELHDLDIDWHFIGPIQSNKTRDIAGHFDWVQSVDREKILKRLANQRPPSLAPLNICLQVNIDDEPQKAGVAADKVGELAALAAQLPSVRLRGLMCIPAQTPDQEQTRQSFERLASLQASLCAEGHQLDTLSMGMSGDLEIAIACGSTMVRIGTDIFGPRPGMADPNGRLGQNQHGDIQQ